MIPLVSTREAISAFTRAGFVYLDGRGKGSHHVMVRAQPPATLVIPERREIPRGTLRSLLRAADISPEEFITLLRG
ncbi:MAG: type II toxin-antitoxin system HicA family toxin [Phycisphaerales bacterium]